MRISDWSSDVCSSDLLNGVDVTEHDIRMPSEELDIVLWNAQTEEILRPWASVILVECKNWSTTVGADRKSVVEVKRVSVRVCFGGRRTIKTKRSLLKIQ